jgi:hypothetical protein
VPYPPINNATTQDGWTPALTLAAPKAQRWNVDVANAAVYVCFGDGWPDVRWDSEQGVFVGPGFRSYDRSKDAVRIRSAAAGHPAQVTIEALGFSDLGIPTLGSA